MELPVHPGAVLREDYLKPLSMSANALAKALSVPAPSINDVIRERRSISADSDMRVALNMLELIANFAPHFVRKRN